MHDSTTPQCSPLQNPGMVQLAFTRIITLHGNALHMCCITGKFTHGIVFTACKHPRVISTPLLLLLLLEQNATCLGHNSCPQPPPLSIAALVPLTPLGVPPSMLPPWPLSQSSAPSPSPPPPSPFYLSMLMLLRTELLVELSSELQWYAAWFSGRLLHI